MTLTPYSAREQRACYNPSAADAAATSLREGGRFLHNTAPAHFAPGPLASLWTYAFSPSGMMQVIRVRQLQEFQPDQGQPSEATGPGAI